MAKAPTTKAPAASATPQAPKAPAPQKKGKAQIPALFVRSRREHFYRAGYKWTKAGHGIALDSLTDEQIAALKAEPMLIVEEVTIDAGEAASSEADA